jgi:hypothetical protein
MERTMATIAYTVAAVFADGAVADEWLRWLREGHIADVLAGGASDAEIVELEATNERSFEIRYHFSSREAFDRYIRDHAPRLRAEGLERFSVDRGIQYRRSVGVVAERFPR